MFVRISLVLALVAPAAFARSYGDFDVASPPRWVETVAVNYEGQIARDAIRFGLFDLLSDHQIRVTATNTAHFYRTVRKVLSTSGVQNASELSIGFDPTYQRLVLHDISIIRGTARINALRPDDVRVIDNEDEADSQIYDGDLNALVFINDVRPGDVIDYSWSLDGANPILQGKFADEFELSSTVPTKHIRHRLLWPADRTLRISGGQATLPVRTSTEEQAGLPVLHVFERFDVEPVDIEDEAPVWFDPWQTVQVTEFASWSEVAQWAAGMFEPDQQSVEEIRKLADVIRSEHTDPLARATAAIRFVQDEIRYLGIEIGRNSHEPRQPSQTLSQRWGDCKEKAFVLSLLLRELGVPAQPALVSTRLRHTLDQRLPSPFAFDHVIVRVQSGRNVRWVDPTIAYQGGTLETIDTPDDARALVVDTKTSRLTPIAAEGDGRIVIEETYTAQKESAPTSLDIQTTYSGHQADAARAALAGMSGTDLARDRINDHAADHPEIAATAPPHVTDDRDRNIIVIRERYRVNGMWKGGHWTFYPRAIERHLSRPSTIVRSSPLAVEHPLDVEQHATFRFPAPVHIETDRISRSSPALRYTSAVKGNGRAITVETSLRSVRDAIQPREVPVHLKTLNSIRESIGVTIRPSFTESASAGLRQKVSAASSMIKWTWLSVVLMVLLASGIGLVGAIRQSRT